MKLIVPALCAIVLAAGGAAAQTLPPIPDAQKPTALNAFAFNVVDIEKMRTFYETAFGLKVAARVPATGEVREYLMNFTGVRENRPLFILYKVAGPRLPGQDQAGRIVLGVPNAAALTRRAVAAGGRAQEPIREGATNFVYDPEGNRIELYQPAPPAAPK